MASSGTANGQPRQISSRRRGSSESAKLASCKAAPVQNTLTVVSTKSSRLSPYLGEPSSSRSSSCAWTLWLSVMGQRFTELERQALELRSELCIQHADFGLDA